MEIVVHVVVRDGAVGLDEAALVNVNQLGTGVSLELFTDQSVHLFVAGPDGIGFGAARRKGLKKREGRKLKLFPTQSACRTKHQQQY